MPSGQYTESKCSLPLLISTLFVHSHTRVGLLTFLRPFSQTVDCYFCPWGSHSRHTMDSHTGDKTLSWGAKNWLCENGINVLKPKPLKKYLSFTITIPCREQNRIFVAVSLKQIKYKHTFKKDIQWNWVSKTFQPSHLPQNSLLVTMCLVYLQNTQRNTHTFSEQKFHSAFQLEHSILGSVLLLASVQSAAF